MLAPPSSAALSLGPPVHHRVGTSLEEGAGLSPTRWPRSAAEAGRVCVPGDLLTGRRGRAAPASVAPGVHVRSRRGWQPIPTLKADATDLRREGGAEVPAPLRESDGHTPRPCSEGT